MDLARRETFQEVHIVGWNDFSALPFRGQNRGETRHLWRVFSVRGESRDWVAEIDGFETLVSDCIILNSVLAGGRAEKVTEKCGPLVRT